jgi:hypothetical protein
LSLVTGLKTLPENLEPLKDIYGIQVCKAASCKKYYGFDYLEIDETGKLFYSKTIFTEIEQENTIYANASESAVLEELERTYSNCMRIVKLFSPNSDTYVRLHTQAFEKAFELILKPTGYGMKDEKNQIRWDLEKLQKLSKEGFGQNNK